MKIGKLLLAAVVVGVVFNVWDFLVHGLWLQNAYYAGLPSLFRTDTSVAWYVVGDFVFALVFVWVYDRVYAAFTPGAMGGATYGLYAGILLSFPAAIFMHLMFVGFPYGLAWLWMITGVILAVIGGAVAGAVYRR